MSNQVIASKISDVASLMRNKAISPLDLCNFCLERIAKTSSLNAFISVTHDLAQQAAQASHKRYSNGKSH